MVKIIDMKKALQQVRESDAYDNERYIVKGGAVKKDVSNTPDTKDHVYAPNAKIAKQLHSQGKKSYKEDLDKKDVATIKPIIKQLQKSVKSHDKQAKQLTKDISDEKDLEEEIGRISGFKTDKVKKEYETMAKSKGLKTSINSKGSLVIDGPQKAVRDVLTKANIDGINRLTVNIGMGFESLEEQAKELEEQLKTAEKELEELYIKEEKAHVIRFKRITDKVRMVVIFTKQSEADMYADNIKKQGGQVFSNKLEKIPMGYKLVDKK
jgi:hypothetical protein